MSIVAVTGDVHHYLGNHPLEKKEYTFAKEYLSILSDFSASGTLFITGKEINNHKKYWKNLIEKYNLEIGGHTYFGLQPPTLFYIYKHLFQQFNLTYGPTLYQLMDISLTVNSFKNAKIPIKSWRTHGYRGDKITEKLLPEFGIRYVTELKKIKSQTLLNFPIFNYPDDHIFLSILLDKKYDPDEEIKKVKKSIMKGIKKGRDMVLQLHPGSMKVYDDFKFFKNIIEKLEEEDYEFKMISEMADVFDEGLEESQHALQYYDQ